MGFNYLPLFLVFSCLVCRSLLANIPSYIHICRRNDPNLSECVTKSIESLKPQLKQGIPELNVPSIDPLPLQEIKFNSGPNQAQVNADISNLKIWDVALFKIIDLRFNSKKRIIKVKVNLPNLYFKGDYDIDMNVLIIKYKGKGVLSGNFTDYNMDFTLKYDLINKDGGDYMNFPNVEVKIYPGKTTMNVEGLYINDPTLGKTIKQVIRDNSDLLISEVLPILEEGLSAKLTEIANDVTSTFPYKDLLPE